MQPRRIEILGVPVDCVDMQGAVRFVDEMVRKGKRGTVLAVNPEKITTARDNPQLKASLQASSLLIADGIGIVFAARMLGLAEMERVPGADLMPEICALAAKKGYSVFLYGADPEANRGCAEELLRRYPGLEIAGRRHGYIGEHEMDDLVEDINGSGADILFVALGSPRQELWMSQYLDRLHVRVCQGVGGTFNAISGNFARAPRIAMKLHLEWLYQMLMQPKRFRRLPARLKFALSVLKRKWSRHED